MPVPDPIESRAVLIGIDGFTHPDLEPLPAAAAGARRLADLLRDPSVWGLPAAHVTVLGADASVSQVLGAVRDAALEATETLFVYFAGHGLRDRDERLYLALAEADADHPQIGTLPYRMLRDVLRQAGYRARHRVTVLDCCYSGLAGAMSGAGVPTRVDLAHALEEAEHPDGGGGGGAGQAPDADDYGDCVLTSAPPTRRSFVPPGARFPEFTGELIALLERGIAGGGPELSLEDAWRSVRRRMRERGSPEPQQFAQNAVAARIRLRNRAALPDATASRFGNGPLAVIDAEEGRVRAYGAEGRVLHSPATTLDALLEWATARAGLGVARLNRHGEDAGPLLVLTDTGAGRFGLPARPDGGSRCLPDEHEAVVRLRRAGWQPAGPGVGAWTRLYRSGAGGRRQWVQLCVLPWGALDPRHWGGTAQRPPAEVARVLGTYAERVITPCGSPADTGLELMTALRPPTRAVREKRTGAWVSAPNPGALTEVVDLAPCEDPDGHPVPVGDHHPGSHLRDPGRVLREETHSWSRPPTAAELRAPHVVGIRVNMMLASAANRLRVGQGAPVHVERPRFDKTLPGSWLVDLSHIALDARLPSPFTPHGRPPAGAAWYTTPTLAYAVELGFAVHPLEAYVRTRSGGYLDAWYKRLRDGYLATMADLGVTPGLTGKEFLDAMARGARIDPGAAAVLGAIEATAEGGLDMLAERPYGAAPPRPARRPDIRAAVGATARVNTHRKMLKVAREADLFPLAVAADCVVYASDGPSPLDFLPRTPEGEPLPGGFRLGVTPGWVTYAGTRSTAWAEDLRAAHGPDVNIAHHIADGGS
ncbi:telomere-associated protein Tap [Streptomyces sp. NPDC090046]|uniref:telomere-associated protein Tap n=1 Tax=Streptomyces sp. NPDC090046 TaxID=3365928 RepID=UPI0038229FBE